MMKIKLIFATTIIIIIRVSQGASRQGAANFENFQISRG
jgi:hypothetical protein